MKKTTLMLAVLAFLVLCSYVMPQGSEWKLKDGYSIKFSSDNPSGVFNSMTGVINFDENNLSKAKFEIQIEAASINTGNGLKNKHAKGERFFDVKKYPYIYFRSTSVTKSASGYVLTGKLKIKETEKEISIPFTFRNNVFSGSFSVNRLDYGVGPESGMAGKASKILLIDISVPVTK
ncbi:YceI family protein [Nemorincola caseinilytica]